MIGFRFANLGFLFWFLLGCGVTCPKLKRTCIPGGLWISSAWTVDKSALMDLNMSITARRSGTDQWEAVNFMKECEICHQYLPSVTRLVLHSMSRHFRLPTLMCSCGKHFYNKSILDLHVERCHCGFHNLAVQTERKFGPPCV